MNNLTPESKARHRQIIRSFEARFYGKRTVGERFADYFIRTFGNIKFLAFNLFWFFVWVIWNLGLISGLPVFDPYPFILLITIVSLEAIVLSVIVLISQNRSAKISRLRSEVDFQINLISEQEITKILGLLAHLMEKQGIDVGGDPEIQNMLKKIDLGSIEKKLEEQLDK